jgi:copper(I)-binding protein
MIASHSWSISMYDSIGAIARMFTRPIRRPSRKRLGLVGLVLTLLFSTAPLLWAHEFRIGDLEIEHPWSRATPTGAKVAAGYLVIRNNGSTPDKLVSVTGEIAGMAEVHQMGVDDNGVMTMRPVEGGIVIPAGGKVVLSPDGYHIMFIGPKQPLVEGGKFPVSLTFTHAGTIGTFLHVLAIGAKGPDMGGMGGMSNDDMGGMKMDTGK